LRRHGAKRSVDQQGRLRSSRRAENSSAHPSVVSGSVSNVAAPEGGSRVDAQIADAMMLQARPTLVTGWGGPAVRPWRQGRRLGPMSDGLVQQLDMNARRERAPRPSLARTVRARLARSSAMRASTRCFQRAVSRRRRARAPKHRSKDSTSRPRGAAGGAGFIRCGPPPRVTSSSSPRSCECAQQNDFHGAQRQLGGSGDCACVRSRIVSRLSSQRSCFARSSSAR